MNSKIFLLLGLLLAIVLLISSEVSARDLADNAEKETKVTNGEFDANYSEDQYGGGGGGYRCRYRGCGGSGGGYGCRYDCCGWGGGGYGSRRCRRCCSYAGEAIDAEPQT